MRFPRPSVILAASVLLLISSNLLQAVPEHSISGRLVFENFDFACNDGCVVTLLVLGSRPVQTTMADFSGRFTFHGVTPGLYTIRVEINGIEMVNQPLDARDNRYEVSIMVPRIRKAAASTSGAPVVDVSEFLERYPKKAVSLFEKGIESLNKKKAEEAVKYLQNAVELAPTFYEAHNQLGIAYRQAGRLDDAEREFLKARELNSTNVEPLLNLTDLYLDENDTDRAVNTGEQAVKVNSRSPFAFFSLGVALYKAAQLDRAEDALKRALDLAPKMAGVHLMLANVYLKLRRYDKTLEQLNTYIAENPKGNQIEEAMRMRDQLLQGGATDRP
jgi:tetratricopeptide (TPR) repeat protein